MKSNVSTDTKSFKKNYNSFYNPLIHKWQNIKYMVKTGLPKELNQGKPSYV